jgi:hypothetical protein
MAMKTFMARFIDVVVSNDEVIASDMRAIALICSFAPGTKACLAFWGYDKDSREVWDIPEIRAYVKRALARYPKFLSRLDLESRRVVRDCICRGAGPVNSDGTCMADPLGFVAWQQFASAAGINPSE